MRASPTKHFGRGWYDLEHHWRAPLLRPAAKKSNGLLYRWCVRCGVKTCETEWLSENGHQNHAHGCDVACESCAVILNRAEGRF